MEFSFGYVMHRMASKSTSMNRLKSFRYAFNGLVIVLSNEPNARVHVLSAVTSLILGDCLNISPSEWLAVILSICLVLSLEIINTAIEELCDYTQPAFHPQIKKVKDLSAAAVLVSAVSALAIGLIIFIPKILKLC